MTFAISLIAISLIAWLMIRGGVPANTAYARSPEPHETANGAIACARESLERGDVTAEEYERIVSILRS
jgi:uncharacterized membrane protein